MHRFDTPEERARRIPGDRVRDWVRKGESLIAAEQAGTRLDRFLAERFTYRSRTQWRQLIETGRITLNGNRARPSRTLREGDRIQYVPLEREEPPIDHHFTWLYQDDYLLAVAKSGNLPVHPSGRYFRHTLLSLLHREHSDCGPFHIVHRLDRETSGVILFGRSPDATERLARQFRSRQVRKRYLAMVDGIPPEDAFTVDAPLGRSTDSRIRKAVGVRKDGVPARTEVRVLHRGSGWCWLEARPFTGRLHQIRVHLRSVGLPIVGDKVYGHDEDFFLKFVHDEPLNADEKIRLGFHRQALHAYQIDLCHPRDEHPMTVTAPLPPDLAGLLRSRGLDPAPWIQSPGNSAKTPHSGPPDPDRS